MKLDVLNKACEACMRHSGSMSLALPGDWKKGVNFVEEALFSAVNAGGHP